MTKRGQYSARFKATVAIQALRGELTVAQGAKKSEAPANRIAGGGVG